MGGPMVLVAHHHPIIGVSIKVYRTGLAELFLCTLNDAAQKKKNARFTRVH